eukprot:9482653-Pyramimonas_sp.AAC.1
MAKWYQLAEEGGKEEEQDRGGGEEGEEEEMAQRARWASERWQEACKRELIAGSSSDTEGVKQAERHGRLVAAVVLLNLVVDDDRLPPPEYNVSPCALLSPLPSIVPMLPTAAVAADPSRRRQHLLSHVIVMLIL